MDVDAAAGVVTARVRNDGSTSRRLEVTLHALDGSAQTQASKSTSAAIAPGETGLVRFTFEELDLTLGGLPIPLKAELIARDDAGGIAARSFVHASAG